MLSIFFADYYSNSYRKDYQRVSFGPTLKHVKKTVTEARSRLAKLNLIRLKNPKVLDFGCGSGEFVELTQKRFLEDLSLGIYMHHMLKNKRV